MREQVLAVVAAWAFAAVGGLVYAQTGGVHARSQSGSASSSPEEPQTSPLSCLLSHGRFSR
jgi:hypothetical protein